MPRPRNALGQFMGKAAREAKASRASAPAIEPDRDAPGAAPSEPFLSELQASWARHGAATIDKVRVTRPHDYLRLMASSLAKQAEGKTDPIEAMSDDEIADELRTILERLAAAGADPGA